MGAVGSRPKIADAVEPDALGGGDMGLRAELTGLARGARPGRPRRGFEPHRSQALVGRDRVHLSVTTATSAESFNSEKAVVIVEVRYSDRRRQITRRSLSLGGASNFLMKPN